MPSGPRRTAATTRLQLARDTGDGVKAAVVVFQIRDHHLVPKAERLEIRHQRGVGHGEFPRHVGLHVKVLEGGLDRLADAADVGDRRGRGDGEGVGIAHAAPRPVPQPVPAEPRGPIEGAAAAGLCQQREAVVRQDAARSERAVEAGIGAAFLGRIGKRRVGRPRAWSIASCRRHRRPLCGKLSDRAASPRAGSR